MREPISKNGQEKGDLLACRPIGFDHRRLLLALSAEASMGRFSGGLLQEVG